MSTSNASDWLTLFLILSLMSPLTKLVIYSVSILKPYEAMKNYVDSEPQPLNTDHRLQSQKL